MKPCSPLPAPIFFLELPPPPTPTPLRSCGGGDAGLSAAGANKPQRLSACPDPPGFDRTKYGMQPGVGRGAPEIDLVEMK